MCYNRDRNVYIYINGEVNLYGNVAGARVRARNSSQTAPILFITLKSARMLSDGGGRRNEVAGHGKNRFNLFERVRRSCRRARGYRYRIRRGM